MKKIISIFLLSVLSITYAVGQNVPTPKEFFGHHIGDPYQLINYTKAERYFKEVADLSDRVILQEMGKTEEGRSHYMIIISSPENLANLEKYKSISHRLARAEVSESEATSLIEEGKPVVWIDGGLHSTETVGSQQLIELFYTLTSREDKETLRILDDVVILLSLINPDGLELVADWYMQEKDPSKRNMSIPRLYQKYVGHDNNRDWYMNNMKESQNVSRQLYVEWMPQIVYNHHQTGPAGTVLAGPPYRDPFNYVYDPLVITGIDGVAASMINRLNEEGKPGYTRLGGSGFNTWWNGGMRTAPYFHNMIGLLTEITGNPTPASDSQSPFSLNQIPFIPDRLIADNNDPFPVHPQEWPYRRSIDYSLSLNYAVLDYASRMGDLLLKNIYRMGRNAIERGEKDSWTIVPKNVEEVKSVYEKDLADGVVESIGSGRGAAALPKEYYEKVLQDPAKRDPRGYIIPADQKDFPTAVKFLNALIQSGVQVHRATSSFTVAGKNYPSGSYIVKTAQAFRPHVLDMFEPQNYRNDFMYPGGPPIAPYDSAGWTLALQMGVEFDRVLDAFDGPFEKLPFGEVQDPDKSAVAQSSGGYVISGSANDSYKVVNALLSSRVNVERLTTSFEDQVAGSFYADSKAYSVLKEQAENLGVSVKSVSRKPSSTVKISPKRIALFDRYGGSMPSGWVRWLMEKYDFAFDVIYPQDIDKGNLNSKYDVILFISEGIPSFDNSVRSFVRSMPDKELVPSEFHPWMGNITKEKSIPELKKFVENGGDIVTVGNSTHLAYHFGVPVKNALVEIDKRTGEEKPLDMEHYYVPSSVLKIKVNTESPATWGLDSNTLVIFNNNPVYKVAPNAKNVEILSWFSTDELPLLSGWAWGQNHLKGGVTSFAAKIGKGNLYAFSPEITFRAQSHGTFKLLFNQLYKNQ